MEANDITEAKRIISKLKRLGQPPIRIAKIFYPYRSWFKMRRVLINHKWTKEDIEAWEQAIINYKKRRIREKTSKCNRKIQAEAERELGQPKEGDECNEGNDKDAK